MPTANYDSSLLTQRHRNNALYYWNQKNKANVAAGLSVLREQPNTQLATYVTYRDQTAGNTNFNGGAPCGCTKSVLVNPGGNSTNVQ